MRQKLIPEPDYEILIKKWEELKKLDFPESPGEPFLDNLYIELAEYDIYVSNIARSILDQGEKIDRQLIKIDDIWNERLDTFNPEQTGHETAYSALRQYKQTLDEFISIVLAIENNRPC